MKIAVIGGAGVRTPLLVGGLTSSDLPVTEIALYDTDPARLSIIGSVAARMAKSPRRGLNSARVTLASTVADCVRDADFVFTSIRAGGIAQRVRDEATAQRHGIVGQETIGPAGFAMAARTIPQMVAYAREIARESPGAWIINFTNPVGMITEAMRTASDRVIGICDTPTELFAEVARVLDLPVERCHFDYFGLNHLGWLREVYAGGVPQLPRLWDDEAKLRSVYKVPLFEAPALRALRLLPTEYVYYYDQPQRAYENVRRAGQSRGQAIEELTRVLFDTLAERRHAPDAEVIAVYRSYLWTRSAGYMQIESGSEELTPPATESELSGYDKIALGVVRAIHFNANAIIPLSVRNCGAIPELRDGDIVELPCVVNANGARPLQSGPVPDRVAPLLARVREYERLTVRAALARSIDEARAALAHNPLVPNEFTASRLIDDLAPLW
jgi:6-phospho-beta-glucosidase